MTTPKRRYRRLPEGCKLSALQQEAVLKYSDLAYTLAYRIWQKLHLPAKDLEDLRAESQLQLCMCVLRYQGQESGLEKVLIFQVYKTTQKLAIRLKKHRQLPEDAEYDIPLPEWEDSEEMDSLLRCLPCLSKRQQEVIELRYGLAGQEPMSARGIAREISTVQSNVTKTEKKAITSLREMMT